MLLLVISSLTCVFAAKKDENKAKEISVLEKNYEIYTDKKKNQLKIYDMPTKMKEQKSALYKVELKLPNDTTWHEVDVYSVYTANAKSKGREDTAYNIYEAGIVYFDFKGTIQVRVTPTESFSEVRIRPKDRIVTKIEEKAITFTMKKAGQYSLELYSNGSWQTQTNLHIFANEIVKEVKQDKYDIYFGPGVHDYTTDKDVIKLDSNNNPYIKLESNMSMYIAGGAVVKAAIQVNNATNVKIEGRGILDLVDCLEKDSNGNIIMTNINSVTKNPIPAIRIKTASKVTIDGIIIRNSPRYSISGSDVTNCKINNVKIITGGRWTDGIDMMSSSNVTITNCFIRTCDDCIAIYGSRGDSGFVTGKFLDSKKGNAKNWKIKNTILWADDAHAINIGTHGYYLAPFDKGETVQGLTFENISVLQTRSLAKTGVSTGGVITLRVRDNLTVKNVTFKNFSIENIENSHLISIIQDQGAQGQSPSAGIKNAKIEDLMNPGYLITKIKFKNINYVSADNKVKTGLIEMFGIDKDNDGTKSVKNGDSIISGVDLDGITLNGKKLVCTKEMIEEYLNTNATAMNIKINGTSIINPIKASQTKKK